MPQDKGQTFPGKGWEVTQWGALAVTVQAFPLTASFRSPLSAWEQPRLARG